MLDNSIVQADIDAERVNKVSDETVVLEDMKFGIHSVYKRLEFYAHFKLKDGTERGVAIPNSQDYEGEKFVEGLIKALHAGTPIKNGDTVIRLTYWFSEEEIRRKYREFALEYERSKLRGKK